MLKIMLPRNAKSITEYTPQDSEKHAFFDRT